MIMYVQRTHGEFLFFLLLLIGVLSASCMQHQVIPLPNQIGMGIATATTLGGLGTVGALRMGFNPVNWGKPAKKHGAKRLKRLIKDAQKTYVQDYFTNFVSDKLKYALLTLEEMYRKNGYDKDIIKEFVFAVTVYRQLAHIQAGVRPSM